LGGFGRPFYLHAQFQAANLVHSPYVQIRFAFRRRSALRRSFIKNRSYLMAKKAVKRREWTSVDVKTLRSLAKKKTQAGRIAKVLKRTEGATCQKAFSLGLSLDAR
jgi:hypothetical protein